MTPSVDVLTDVARRAWAPVTVRVAWTLLLHGVAVKPAVLRDARDHVWLHLEPGTPTSTAVDLAEELTRAFVHRARGRTPGPRWPDDLTMELPGRWRARLHQSPSPRAAWVLRMHYADGIPLERIAERLQEDVLGVEAAREGLRAVVRRAALEDGARLDDWADDRLDHLVHRLVVQAAEGAPPLVEVVDGLHPEWLDRCVTCTRAYALVRRGVLQRGDLVCPRQGARPHDEVRVLALQVHPAARGHRKALAREVPGTAFPIGDDLLLLDGAALPAIEPVLRLCAELGTPRREHVRGAVLDGPGRWSRHGLLGPLVDRTDPVGAVPWGRVEGIGPLPEPLPPPPSPARAWAAVALLGLGTAGVVHAALAPPTPPVDHPITASASAGRGGVWVSFDVAEEATVLVVRERAGKLDVLLDARRPADKIALARGDGSYLLHTVGDAVLIASAQERVGDVAALLTAANATAAPIDTLTAAVRELQPAADVWTHRR